MPIVFVYGTLKRGFPNAHHMPPSCVFVGAARTVERLPLVVGGGENNNIPFVLDIPGEGFRIAGEVFEVDTATEAYLDEFEGLPRRFYKRKEIKVELEDGQTVSAGCYMRGEGGTDWLTKDLFALQHVESYTLDLAELYRSRSEPGADRSPMMDKESE